MDSPWALASSRRSKQTRLTIDAGCEFEFVRALSKYVQCPPLPQVPGLQACGCLENFDTDGPRLCRYGCGKSLAGSRLHGARPLRVLELLREMLRGSSGAHCVTTHGQDLIEGPAESSGSRWFDPERVNDLGQPL